MKDNLEKFREAKFIFVIGIGGSNLASKAVWNAMTLHNPKIKKRILFLESPDEREYAEIKDLTQNQIQNLEDCVLVAVSKSGETTETLATFHKTFEILAEKFGSKIEERIFIISTPNSTLWKIAEGKNIEHLSWQDNVGGRFSAFTIAHTLVLEIAGLDTKSFMEGGREVEEVCKNNPENPAQNLAHKIFENYNRGVKILDFFIFNSELEDLGKWCRQLIAESLSKQNQAGQKVGLVPTVSIGPTDLHSMLQLDLGGPRNRFTLFIKSTKEIDEVINENSYTDTVQAFEKENLPFEKYEMLEINEREIGKFMALMMQITIKLGKLLEVNVFDQPAVENYKKNLMFKK